MLIFNVIGVECNEYNIPIKISILGSFTNVDKALAFREKQNQYTTVDIVESFLDNLQSHSKTEYEMDL
jgi:hypothetical protein